MHVDATSKSNGCDFSFFNVQEPKKALYGLNVQVTGKVTEVPHLQIILKCFKHKVNGNPLFHDWALLPFALGVLSLLPCGCLIRHTNLWYLHFNVFGPPAVLRAACRAAKPSLISCIADLGGGCGPLDAACCSPASPG